MELFGIYFSSSGGTTANPIALIGFFVTWNLSPINCGISSVGLERYLDRVEVTGSNPVFHTILLV